MYHEKRQLPIKGVFPLVMLSFLYDFAFTLLTPIFPVFLLNFLKQDAYVGYFVAFSALLGIVYGFLTVKILEKIKKITLLKISLIGFSATLLALPFITNIPQLIILELFRAFFITASIIPTSLLIREFTSKKNLGKIEGLYFTATNMAWMIGPLVGGILAKIYNFDFLFYISAAFPIIAFILLNYQKLHEHNRTHINNQNIIGNFRDFSKNKSLLINCLMTLFLLFWWSMVYTFIPLYIRDSGFGVNITGWVLFLVVIPLILLEVPAGNLADRFGFKKFFISGFFIMAVLAISTFFADSPIIILTLLILASIGAAFVEPLREAYFFAAANVKDEMRFYPIHRVALPIGQLIGPIIFSTILLLTKTNYKILFLSIGFFMFLASFAAIFLKDIKNHKA